MHPDWSVDTASKMSVPTSRLLPAQDYTVRLVGNTPDEIHGENVLGYFRSENDVLPQESQAGLSRSAAFKINNIDNVETLSFQFRVVPTVTLSGISPAGDYDSCIETGIIVVAEAEKFTMTVVLQEVYLELPQLDGTRLPEIANEIDGTVVVQESVTADGSGNSEYAIEQQVAGKTVFKSYSEISFTAGDPELMTPHMKRVRVSYGQMKPATPQEWVSTGTKSGKGRIKVAVIITGDVQVSNGLTFNIPESVPFLILHDPPGGESSASFTSGNSAVLSLGLAKSTSSGLFQALDVGIFSTTDSHGCILIGTSTG